MFLIDLKLTWLRAVHVMIDSSRHPFSAVLVENALSLFMIEE